MLRRLESYLLGAESRAVYDDFTNALLMANHFAIWNKNESSYNVLSLNEGNKLQQIKLRWALFVTYTIIQSIMRSEMCSLHLTHPSVHTWSSGQPTVQRPGSSRGLPAGAGIRTHNLGLPQVSSPTLYPLGQRLPEIHRGRISDTHNCTCRPSPFPRCRKCTDHKTAWCWLGSV